MITIYFNASLFFARFLSADFACISAHVAPRRKEMIAMFLKYESSGSSCASYRLHRNLYFNLYMRYFWF
jgi:hypothetical protein